MTHTYVCRESCGCAVLLVLDKADKRTGRRVGRAIGGVEWEDVSDDEVLEIARRLRRAGILHREDADHA